MTLDEPSENRDEVMDAVRGLRHEQYQDEMHQDCFSPSEPSDLPTGARFGWSNGRHVGTACAMSLDVQEPILANFAC